ncbi:MAG: peptide chain release factor 1 [Candidatus Thiodiazotropha sp. (ex Lucinoma aequizonata)]|nr:peptide chain release factor 1 [Candidatus Thiodiazotropha sp. (ex Lucinoma aequizonata)]MCU7888483.1 peptide chain release factor 1 [Candidatus Thiodiazotropha sp. (ex Lucinoma aequizonata)]MCU7894762.1 peptide chain release factor 1 [Candidatus Thiodiazotropha sp. (ex Lucinoma aequizonata)]MCU7897205.1 peptide chain release factor 1 [Candidatus Thiodiazotropha sp. (ex Lucinoma aequizonata)]MCU7903428.1 peptide chain release factor 1 [Candidatus Thiodiazotropha sp. (ex Lucinoma aequizonata)
MKPSLRGKLDQIAERFEEITALLADPEIQSNQNQFRDLGREYAQLEPVVKAFRGYVTAEEDVHAAQEMMTDPEMVPLAKEELAFAQATKEKLEPELQLLLIPADPNDQRNVFLEVRAGTGGAEAALFASDLYRMYLRYAESQHWQTETISESHEEHGGYKEVVCRISGNAVYSRLKFESGTHRVQRVPETESQGRVHTSACTVAILAEAAEVDDVEINSGDLRIDTYRASGAGGQHVNKTDSAVRLTHLATGIVVECQDERSQHKNKARAMSLLQVKLLSQAQKKITSEQASSRKLQVGSGGRSERIRTYNFPQNRLNDHRINLTLYKLDEVMTGALDQVIDPLLREQQVEALATMGET